MPATALDRETLKYWDSIKGAGRETKLTLISLLSTSLKESMDNDCVAPEHRRKLRARHRSVTAQLPSNYDAEPIPLPSETDSTLSGIIDANSGKLIEGLEKWL